MPVLSVFVCGACGAESTRQPNNVPPPGWLMMGAMSGPEYLCSWQCVADYGAARAEEDAAAGG